MDPRSTEGHRPPHWPSINIRRYVAEPEVRRGADSGCGARKRGVSKVKPVSSADTELPRCKATSSAAPTLPTPRNHPRRCPPFDTMRALVLWNIAFTSTSSFLKLARLAAASYVASKCAGVIGEHPHMTEKGRASDGQRLDTLGRTPEKNTRRDSIKLLLRLVRRDPERRPQPFFRRRDAGVVMRLAVVGPPRRALSRFRYDMSSDKWIQGPRDAWTLNTVE
jgi:hypothetical protein